ncbi:MAG: hypothetical protein WDM77_00810 [Steroidobacteraceae bacterium]
MNTPPHTFRFNGPVTWAPGPGRTGITLLGALAETDGKSTAAQLSLSCAAPPELPPLLNDMTVEALPLE